MARVTVEDCVRKVPNRFDLVMYASVRARQISSGSVITVARNNDKNPIVSLREIAEDNIDLAKIEELMIKDLQKAVLTDSFEEAVGDDILENMRDASQWYKDEPTPKTKEFDDSEPYDDEIVL